MPPHCDTLDGPVVKAAKKALEDENVNLILPYAPKEAEEEIKKAYEKTIAVRRLGDKARELADYSFYETIVRLHRTSEGAAYEGLKPAGLDVGPVIPLAEKALETGDSSEVVEFISQTVKEAIEKKFKLVQSLKNYDEDNVDDARKYVSAMLDFLVSSHHLYTNIKQMAEHSKHENSELGEKTHPHEHVK